MNAILKAIAGLLIFCSAIIGCKGQPATGLNQLKLEKTILLPGVKGRIDHLDVNVKSKIVYIAALGNNSLEIADIVNGKIIHSITGLDEPQGVSYIPQTNEICVANGGNGDCYFFNASSFEKTGSVHLSSDADDTRYDSAGQKIYAGYGNGAIAVIDAVTHKQTGDIKLPAHPEGFQLNTKTKQLFVNVPDAHCIGVIDLVQNKLVNKWENKYSANFPLAIDTINNHLFVGYRHPAKLVVLDAMTGKQISVADMAGDVDDLYYDYKTDQVYVSGGSGYINIFRQQGTAVYKQIANIATSNGARTSLLIPSLQLFIVAHRAESGNPAQLSIYDIMP